MSSMSIETYGPGGFDPAKPAGNVVDTKQVPLAPEVVNENTIRDQAVQALAGNKAYVALASPTAAQTTAQVKALSRQMNGLIRLVLGRLDATD